MNLRNRTLFVPSYSDHIVLPSKYVIFSPNENGKFNPDFCTKEDTAAEPRFLSRSIVELATQMPPKKLVRGSFEERSAL